MVKQKKWYLFERGDGESYAYTIQYTDDPLELADEYDTYEVFSSFTAAKAALVYRFKMAIRGAKLGLVAAKALRRDDYVASDVVEGKKS